MSTACCAKNEAAAVAATTSSCCNSGNGNSDKGHHHHHHSCLAVVDGVNVWLWDVEGIARRYILQGSISGSGHDSGRHHLHTMTHRELCFSSHNNQDVDDLLTPCLDEQGRHGTPAEDCFCGEDEPHLHAHWHHPKGCSTGKQDDVERLADLILMPHPHDSEEEKNSDEEAGECHDFHHHHDPHAVSFMAKQHGWPCTSPKHPLIRPNEETLIWERSDCCHNDEKNDEMTCHDHDSKHDEPPSFSFAGRRAWKTEQPVRLDFFFLGQQLAACGCQKDCCGKDEHGKVICNDQDNSPCAYKNKTKDGRSADTQASPTEGKSTVDRCCSSKHLGNLEAGKSSSSSCGNKSDDACCASKSKACGSSDEDKSKVACIGGGGGGLDEKTECCASQRDKLQKKACSSIPCSHDGCCEGSKDAKQNVELHCQKSDCCATSKAMQIEEDYGIPSHCNDGRSGGSKALNQSGEPHDLKSNCCTERDESNLDSCRGGCCAGERDGVSGEPEKNTDGAASNKKAKSLHCEDGCCSGKDKAEKKSDCCAGPKKGCDEVVMGSSPDCCAGDDDCGASKLGLCGVDSAKSCCTSKECGADAIEPVTPKAGTGRSQFCVSGICCASEIPTVQRFLDEFEGIEKVTVNPTTAMVYVDHQIDLVSAEQMATALTRKGMKAEVQVDGARAATRSKLHTLFVVSKFIVGENGRADENALSVDKDRIDVLMKAYEGTQVESFVFDQRTSCLTVVHNPWTIKTSEIEKAIERATKAKVEVLLDGADCNHAPLDYAALANSASVSDKDDGNSASVSNCPRPTVVISGLFWVISMLSLIGDNFEHLKYVALASVAFGLPPIAKKAVFTLTQRYRFDTNGLMLMASIGALALGEFLEAGAVVFLFALSEWLEKRASSRARQALSAIVRLRPDKARIIHPETQELWTVPATAVPVGSLVSVKTGDKIPCDGIVVEGQSTVDESSLTGESRPIKKGPKTTVSGGTVNSGIGQLVVRTTSTADDSAVARLIRLVEEAQVNRSETEKKIDRFSAVYTPIVLFAAVLMCTIPWAFGSETGREWTHNGLVLIVVACPCALIISTPVSYVAGLAASAQKGVLIKGGAFLEALGQVKHICVDKTGTLTTGEFLLLHLEVVGEFLTRMEVLEYLLLMEERASHPVAQAIMTAARNENVSIPQGMMLESHTVLAGEGVTGIINGHEVFVGNERLFDRQGFLSNLPQEVVEKVHSWKQLGGTIGFIGMKGYGIVGAYCAADAVRPEASEVVKAFQKRGIALSMLTGDNEEAARSVGAQLGWHGDKNEIHAKLLPADKLAYVEELTTSSDASFSCFQKNMVLFCGDGVNDAPALAAAHVGVAMGSGATVAMETAHVTLLDPSLCKLEFALQMGRRVLRKIYENVIFSIVVKAAVLVWALTGTPSLWAAIGSDVGSMLLVTLNSMRLLPSSSRARSRTTDFSSSFGQKDSVSAHNLDLEKDDAES